MQIKQFEYMLEIARYGSIRQAADNLYISQQALSETLKKVEDKLGFHLFQRTNKGVVPTANGAKVLRDMADMVQHVKSWEQYKEKNNVHVILQYLVGDLMLDQEFHDALQQLVQYEIQFETMRIHDIAEQIEKGEPCAALFFYSKESDEYLEVKKVVTSKNCKIEPLASGELTALCVLMQKDTPWVPQQETLAAEHLSGKVMKLNKDMTTIKSMRRFCEKANLRMDGLPRSVKPLDVVAHQTGTFTLVPEFIARKNIYVKNGALITRRLAPEFEEEWSCYLVYQTKWEQMLQPLLQEIRQYFSKL